MNTTFRTTGLAQTTGSTRGVFSLFRRYWGAFQEWRKRERLRADLCGLNDREAGARADRGAAIRQQRLPAVFADLAFDTSQSVGRIERRAISGRRRSASSGYSFLRSFELIYVHARYLTNSSSDAFSSVRC